MIVLGTDKIVQGYLDAYCLLAQETGLAAKVCEIGVYQGESLRLWQLFFPDGEVTGVDCDPAAHWPPGTRRVVARAEDPALPAILGGPFDLIVDDGCHDGDVAAATFRNLWPLVSPGGYYVIEDWYIGLREYEAHPMFNEAMLDTVASMLRLLGTQNGEVSAITYTFGLCIIHKRGKLR